MPIKLVPALFLALFLSGCGGPNPFQKALTSLTAEFTGTALSFSPASATAAGYHRHGKILLDELLDDYLPVALDRQRLFFSDLSRRLEHDVKPSELDAEESRDCEFADRAGAAGARTDSGLSQ